MYVPPLRGATTLTRHADVVGNVFSTIGSTGFDFINSLVMADLVPLKWRGLAMALLTTPYLATVWYTSEIVAALSNVGEWRWGYGMFAIIYAVRAKATLLTSDPRR